MQVILTIRQSEVLKEVAQTTEYTGSKMDGDSGAYDRIRTVDADHTELKRFWDESRAEVAQAFIRLLDSEGMYDYSSSTYTPNPNGDYYRLTLNVSGMFDTSLEPGMQLGLYSYFVQSITARWYMYSNKGEAKDYAVKAAAQLEEVKQKAFYKKAPTRPYH